MTEESIRPTRGECEALFRRMRPGFFAQASIASLPEGRVYEEMLLPLAGFDAPAVPVPEDVTFGFFQGDRAALLAGVREVDADWPAFFGAEDRVFCAAVGGEVASFCLIEDMGRHPLAGRSVRIGGQGCVGTVPAFRRQGIGLEMVRRATALLRDEGFDLSWIHYTGVAPWYAKLGYRTILRWDRGGFRAEDGKDDI